VILALVLVGGGIAAFVAMQGGDADAPNPAAKEAAPGDSTAAAAPTTSAATPPAATTPSPTPLPPPTEKVTIKFAVTPATAKITLDGKDVTGELVTAKDDVEHVLSVTAPGFVAHSEKVRFDESQRISITLAKQAKATPTGGKKTGGKRDKIEVESPYQ
jgi:hypothetical protein